ncbi:MAG: hypothetical protein K2M61_05575 [Muribaculaceae bacterium]|nr:hypothetical protein [Muribaculaceae bacterium]
MKKLLAGIISCAAVLGATSCHKVTVTPTKVVPLYTTLADFDSMDSLRRDSVMRTDSVAIRAFMQVLGCDSVTDSIVERWSQSRVVEAFTPEVRKVYPNVSEIENMISWLLQKAKVEQLDLPSRQYVAVVWGLQKSIVFNDTTMLIALNHYLGRDFQGYQGLPEYLRMGKTPQRLPYDMAEAMVANRYPYEKNDSSTILSRMVYEGALTLAKIKMVPDGSLQGALGYTTEQLQWLDENQGSLWNEMTNKKLIYSTSEDVMDKLMAPAPATTILSPYSPGRVGRYIGYCIIVSYLEANAKTTIPQLLSPSFYNNPKILIESAYGG